MDKKYVETVEDALPSGDVFIQLEESVNKINFEAKLSAYKANAKSYLNDYFKSHPNSVSEEPEHISLIRQGYSLVSIVESLQQLTAQLQQESADKERAYTDEYIIRKELQSELQDSQRRIAELEDELRASEISIEIEE